MLERSGMKKVIVLALVVLLATALCAGAAVAATKGVTKFCSTTCIGTNSADQLTGDSSDTDFRARAGDDIVSDTAKHDNDQVRTGDGDDLVDVAEGGNAPNEVDQVVCGLGVDRVKADQNDIVDKATCEKIRRV